jgi:hypothetical protein
MVIMPEKRETLTSADEKIPSWKSRPEKYVIEPWRHAIRVFDGLMFVGVTSTGVYCRPVCPARTPKFEYCRFFGSLLQHRKRDFVRIPKL